MTKKQIEQDLKATFGSSLICMKDIAKYTGYKPNQIKKLMSGVDYLPKGKWKVFFVGDVAEVITNKKQIC